MLITDTLSPQAFEEALRAKGAFYHIHHPYHIAMHNGDATREQIQGWVANRFYYQTTIPLKDAAIMANCPDAQTRRKWVQRILDHDGSHGEDGGIEAGCGWGSGRFEPRRSAQRASRAARRALRSGCLSQFRSSRLLAGGGLQLPDRAVRPADPSVAPRQLAAALSMDQRGRLLYFRSRLSQPIATLSMARRWRRPTVTALKNRTGCWRSCSLSSTFCGRCSMP